MMRTLLLFDGLGGKSENLLPALGAFYREPQNAAYFECVFTALDEVRSHVGAQASDGTPAPTLHLRRWLDAAAGVPPQALGNSVAAGVCVVVHQLCRLQPARKLTGDPVVAALGHSIGLQAAIVAGMRLRRMDDFLAVVARSVKLVALSLIRGHQLAAGSGAATDPRDDTGAPGPMALLTGMSRQDVQQAVDEYNTAERRSVSVGLANSPTAQVLTGATADLLDFRRVHLPTFVRHRATWVFLPNTIPFHSSALAPAVRRVHDDREFIDGSPTFHELRLPVYAADAARNLQTATDLVDEYLQQVFLRPVEWETAANHAVTEADVERVVDCGPGAGARRFTRECLRANTRSLRFESVEQFSRRT